MHLNEVAYEDGFVGIRLISAIKTPGVIAEILSRVDDMDGNERPGFRIQWENGNTSTISHGNCEHIEVPDLEW